MMRRVEVEMSGEVGPGVKVMADIPAHMIRGGKPKVSASVDRMTGRFGFYCEGVPVNAQFVVPDRS